MSNKFDEIFKEAGFIPDAPPRYENTISDLEIEALFAYHRVHQKSLYTLTIVPNSVASVITVNVKDQYETEKDITNYDIW